MDVGLNVTFVQRLRKLQRLRAPLKRRRRLAGQHQRLGFGRQDQRAFRARWLLGHQAHRLTVGRERTVRVGAEPPAPPEDHVHLREAHRVIAGVELGDRLGREHGAALRLLGADRGDRRALQEGHAVDPCHGLGVRHPVPDAERPLAMAQGLRERKRTVGVDARLHRRLQRAHEIAGGVPVVRELARDSDGAGAQRGMVGQSPGQREMQRRSLAGQQVAIHGFADERVAERVRIAVGTRHHHLLGRAPLATPARTRHRGRCRPPRATAHRRRDRQSPPVRATDARAPTGVRFARAGGREATPAAPRRRPQRAVPRCRTRFPPSARTAARRDPRVAAPRGCPRPARRAPAW